MGNRAVIAYVPSDQKIPDNYEEGAKAGLAGIYLHWNGGRESVAAFLRLAREYDIRPDDYGLARLTQIIGNFIGGTYSLGVAPITHLDTNNWDNGTFVVRDWQIVGHWFAPEYLNEHAYNEDYETSVYECAKEINDHLFIER